MTIIAYRNGILATDTAAWRGDYVSGHVRKICRLQDGGLAAASGSSTITEWFLSRMETGDALTSPPSDPDSLGFASLVIRPDGEVFHGDLNMLLVRVKAEWHALGRSSGFTAGALAAGATAVEAVKLTLQWTDAGRGDVEVEYLSPTRAIPFKGKGEAAPDIPDGWPPDFSRAGTRDQAWRDYWKKQAEEREAPVDAD